jgi:sec-independent protein translocase protein TatA
MSWRPGIPELALILVILIFIFGAKRLKDIAKGAGEAVSEFKKATSEPPKKKKEDEAVIEAAKKLGIETEGRSVKQILTDMNEKVVKKEG